MCRPAATVSSTSTVPASSRLAFSWMRIVSAPSGTAAPVKMRSAWPLRMPPANGAPAGASPITRRRIPTARSAARTA
jgi:hypothetical protein